MVAEIQQHILKKDQKTKKAKKKKQIAYTYASVFKFVLFLLIYCMVPFYEKSSLLWFYCKFWYLYSKVNYCTYCVLCYNIILHVIMYTLKSLCAIYLVHVVYISKVLFLFLLPDFILVNEDFRCSHAVLDMQGSPVYI